MKRTLWIAGVMCGTLAAFSQTTAAPAFDVASIRPSSEQAGSYMRFLPGGRLSGMSWIKQVIQIAYGVHDYQVTGGPEWLNTDRYYIEAKTEKTDKQAAPGKPAAEGSDKAATKDGSEV